MRMRLYNERYAGRRNNERKRPKPRRKGILQAQKRQERERVKLNRVFEGSQAQNARKRPVLSSVDESPPKRQKSTAAGSTSATEPANQKAPRLTTGPKQVSQLLNTAVSSAGSQVAEVVALEVENRTRRGRAIKVPQRFLN